MFPKMYLFHSYIHHSLLFQDYVFFMGIGALFDVDVFEFICCSIVSFILSNLADSGLSPIFKY